MFVQNKNLGMFSVDAADNYLLLGQKLLVTNPAHAVFSVLEKGEFAVGFSNADFNVTWEHSQVL